MPIDSAATSSSRSATHDRPTRECSSSEKTTTEEHDENQTEVVMGTGLRTPVVVPDTEVDREMRTGQTPFAATVMPFWFPT